MQTWLGQAAVPYMESLDAIQAARGDVDSSYAASVQTELAPCLWYAESPDVTDHQHLGAYTETTIGAVRTDALRTMLDELTQQPTAAAAALTLDVLRRLETVASVLCQPSLQVDQLGDSLPSEVLRKVSCRLTGVPATGMLDTLAAVWNAEHRRAVLRVHPRNGHTVSVEQADRVKVGPSSKNPCAVFVGRADQDVRGVIPVKVSIPGHKEARVVTS